MFKWKCRFQQPRVDLRGYREELAKILREAIVQAAFQWLNAATAEIPTWSGASQATFLRLARDVGYVHTITPEVSSRIAEGFSKSEGGIRIDSSSNGKVSFFYATTLEHLVYNEYNNANISPDPTLFGQLRKPGPYNFQALAEDAFRRAAVSTVLPDPRRFIKIKNRIRVS